MSKQEDDGMDGKGYEDGEEEKMKPRRPYRQTINLSAVVTGRDLQLVANQGIDSGPHQG